MAQPDPLDERHLPGDRPLRRGSNRYLLDSERVVIHAHQHWAKVALPIAYLVAGLGLALALDESLPASLSFVTNLLWWSWFVLVGWVLWEILLWRHDRFIATDVRLILTFGLITRKVAMMPLVKVTDMSYNRSLLGRFLGYGTFVLESAGQDQALRTIRWVAYPDHTYRVICAEMFGVDDRERMVDEDEPHHRFAWGPRSRTVGPYTDFARAPRPNRTGPADPSTSIRPRPADSQVGEADTGPIPYGG